MFLFFSFAANFSQSSVLENENAVVRNETELYEIHKVELAEKKDKSNHETLLENSNACDIGFENVAVNDIDKVYLDEIRKIASLRRAFRHTIASPAKLIAIGKEILDVEKTLNIENSAKEPSALVFVMLASSASAAIVFAIILAFMHKFSTFAVFAVGMMLASASIGSAARLAKPNAVVKNGILLSNPDDYGKQIAEVKSGTCMQVKKNMNGWIYVANKHERGWLKTDDAILVQ